MARDNNYVPRQTITNAETIKNIPVLIDESQLINGYGFVYEDNKLVLKEIKGSSSGATKFTQLTDVPNTFTGNAGKMLVVGSLEDSLIFKDVPTLDGEAIKKDTLKSIIAGNNVEITENPAGTITISSVGGGGGSTTIAKLSDIGDVPAYYEGGVLKYVDGALEWAVGDEYSVYVNVVSSVVNIPTIMTRAVVVYKNTTANLTQTLKSTSPNKSMFSFANYGNFEVTVDGNLLLPNETIDLVKTSTGWVKFSGDKDYTKQINDIISSIPSNITDLKDVPAYSTASDKAVLTKTANGLAWEVPQNGGGGGSSEQPITTTHQLSLHTYNGSDDNLMYEPYKVMVTGGSEFCTPTFGSNTTVRVTKYPNGDMRVEGRLACKSSAITLNAVEKTESISLMILLEPPKNGYIFPSSRYVSVSPSLMCSTVHQNSLTMSATTSQNVRWAKLELKCNKNVENVGEWKNLSSRSYYLYFDVTLVATAQTKDIVYIDDMFYNEEV